MFGGTLLLRRVALGDPSEFQVTWLRAFHADRGAKFVGCNGRVPASHRGVIPAVDSENGVIGPLALGMLDAACRRPAR